MSSDQQQSDSSKVTEDLAISNLVISEPVLKSDAQEQVKAGDIQEALKKSYPSFRSYPLAIPVASETDLVDAIENEIKSKFETYFNDLDANPEYLNHKHLVKIELLYAGGQKNFFRSIKLYSIVYDSTPRKIAKEIASDPSKYSEPSLTCQSEGVCPKCGKWYTADGEDIWPDEQMDWECGNYDVFCFGSWQSCEGKLNPATASESIFHDLTQVLHPLGEFYRERERTHPAPLTRALHRDCFKLSVHLKADRVKVGTFLWEDRYEFYNYGRIAIYSLHELLPYIDSLGIHRSKIIVDSIEAGDECEHCKSGIPGENGSVHAEESEED